MLEFVKNWLKESVEKDIEEMTRWNGNIVFIAGNNNIKRQYTITCTEFLDGTKEFKLNDEKLPCANETELGRLLKLKAFL